MSPNKQTDRHRCGWRTHTHWVTPLDPCFWATEGHPTPSTLPAPHPPASLMHLDHRDILDLFEIQHRRFRRWWHEWGPSFKWVEQRGVVFVVLVHLICMFGKGAVTASLPLHHRQFLILLVMSLYLHCPFVTVFKPLLLLLLLISVTGKRKHFRKDTRKFTNDTNESF